MSEFETITIDGESLYLQPWENQRGTRFGPTDRDEYEVTVVNLDQREIDKVIAAGRKPTIPQMGSSKAEAGVTAYYKVTSKFKIPMADSQNNLIADNTLIPNGSKIRVYCEVRPIGADFQKGNTHKLYARGVQILELAEMPEDDFEPAQAADVFAKVEGGYTADDSGELPFEEVEAGEDPLA